MILNTNSDEFDYKFDYSSEHVIKCDICEEFMLDGDGEQSKFTGMNTADQAIIDREWSFDRHFDGSVSHYCPKCSLDKIEEEEWEDSLDLDDNDLDTLEDDFEL